MIKDILLRPDLPTEKFQGFVFDCVADMSDRHSGVRVRLKEVCTDALYVPCSNHCLNLSLQEVGRTVRLVADTFAFVREQANLFELQRKETMRLLQFLVMASQCNRDPFVQHGGL